MTSSTKMVLTSVHPLNRLPEFSPQDLQRTSTYHNRSVSQCKPNPRQEKKRKSNDNDIGLILKLKAKQTPTNRLRNIYANRNNLESDREQNSNYNESLAESNREKMPRSILKKKISTHDTSSKGICFTYLTANYNNKDDKDRDYKENCNTKAECKIVSFGTEKDYLVRIYEPKQFQNADDKKEKDKEMCICECLIY